MAITRPFDTHADMYEQWFQKHKMVYETELEAIRLILPEKAVNGDGEPAGVEIGAGSGLFASRLGISYGLEPSAVMLEKAKERGLEMKQGVAEKLPYPDSCFDYTLMVTAICFLDDMQKAFHEIRRVLKTGGVAIFGFVDKDSPLGQQYQQHKEENVFYAPATFYSATEVLENLEETGFTTESVHQTVFGDLDTISSVQPIEEGYGKGGFVVLKAVK